MRSLYAVLGIGMIRVYNDSEEPCMMSGHWLFLMVFYMGIRENYYASLTITFC